jgi:tripartite-type tricarboxylate transporter receptor subunit TctC
MKHSRQFLKVALCSALGILIAQPGARAQDYPSKPIRLILPTIPGSAFELLGRLVGTKMGEAMGHPVVAENRAGANGMIGAEVVARAAPDGYTLLWATPSQVVTSVFLSKTLPIDPAKDLLPISIAAEPVTVLLLNPQVPVSNVREFVDYAKRYPGKMSYGSPGIGSFFHFTGELMKQAAGLDIVHVPYKGPPQALNDVFAGRIEMTLLTLGSARPLEKAGKIKILALLEPQRYAGAPDLPTFTETVPSFEKPASWYALFGQPALPRPIVMRLYRELAASLKTTEARNWLETNMHTGVGNTPEEFAVVYKQAFEVFGRAVKVAGIKPE